jgi:NCS2 family nucleobase:cation symporter-2
MTLFAGALEILLAVYLHRLRAFFPPAISGFIVVIVGIQLGLVAMDHVLDIDNFNRADYGRHLIVSCSTLALIIGLSVWSSGAARLMCSAIGIAAGLVIAALLGIIPTDDWKVLAEAQIIGLPDPSYIAFDFEPSLLPAFLVAGAAAALRTIGVVTTCQKINDEELKRPDIASIRGGMVADGIGCMLGGAFGAMGMNSGPSLVGVSKASGATSRTIAFAAAGFLILFSLTPVIASVFMILPDSVVGAALLFTACFMIGGGIQIMVARNIDTRMTYVVGISMLMGLSRVVFQDFFKNLPQALHPISSSMLSLAVVSALVLHIIFRIGSRRTSKIQFEHAERPVTDLADLLEKQAETWNVEQEVVGRAISTTRQVLEHIERAHLVDSDLTVVLRYDDFTFVVDIEYRGTLLSLPHVGIRKWSFLEEESFSYGLADFLTGAYPDRMESSAHGADITIKLHFGV